MSVDIESTKLRLIELISIRSPTPILILPLGGLTFGSKVKQWTQLKPRLARVAAHGRCIP